MTEFILDFVVWFDGGAVNDADVEDAIKLCIVVVAADSFINDPVVDDDDGDNGNDLLSFSFVIKEADSSPEVISLLVVIFNIDVKQFKFCFLVYFFFVSKVKVELK